LENQTDIVIRVIAIWTIDQSGYTVFAVDQFSKFAEFGIERNVEILRIGILLISKIVFRDIEEHVRFTAACLQRIVEQNACIAIAV